MKYENMLKIYIKNADSVYVSIFILPVILEICMVLDDMLVAIIDFFIVAIAIVFIAFYDLSYIQACVAWFVISLFSFLGIYYFYKAL